MKKKLRLKVRKVLAQPHVDRIYDAINRYRAAGATDEEASQMVIDSGEFTSDELDALHATHEELRALGLSLKDVK